MQNAADDLLREHQTIIFAIDIIENMVKRVEMAKPIDAGDIGEMIHFLKVFADRCHHAKEENYLFPALERSGIKSIHAPVGIVLNQHHKGRELIRLMEKSVENQKINREDFIYAATAYVALMKDHIHKENTILFPMINEMLSQSERDKLMDDFVTLEEEIIGEGLHEELVSILEQFGRKYLSEN
jgi:hemerythrin-like domain-containing protein